MKTEDFILKFAETYENDGAFKAMVDNTIFLTVEQRQASQIHVDKKYGVKFRGNRAQQV